MSADNGVYIGEFSDGFRVILTSAIENIFYYPKGSEERKNEFQRYFGTAKVFETKDEAMKEAFQIYESVINNDTGFGGSIIEYGIQLLGKLEDFE